MKQTIFKFLDSHDLPADPIAWLAIDVVKQFKIKFDNAFYITRDWKIKNMLPAIGSKILNDVKFPYHVRSWIKESKINIILDESIRAEYERAIQQFISKYYKEVKIDFY